MPYHYVKWTAPLEIVKIIPNSRKVQKAPKGNVTVVNSETVIRRDFQIPGARHQRGGSQVIPF